MKNKVEILTNRVAQRFPRLYLAKELQWLLAGIGLGVGTVCIGILIGRFIVN